MSLKEKVYPKTYYHSQINIKMDEIITKLQVPNLQIAS